MNWRVEAHIPTHIQTSPQIRVTLSCSQKTARQPTTAMYKQTQITNMVVLVGSCGVVAGLAFVSRSG